MKEETKGTDELNSHQEVSHLLSNHLIKSAKRIKQSPPSLEQTDVASDIVTESLQKKSSSSKEKYLPSRLIQVIQFLLQHRSTIILVSKYAFTALLIIFSYRSSRNFLYTVISFLELAGIALASNYLLRFNKLLAHGVNYLFMFLLNVELLVMLFGGSYVSLVMVTNLESLEALSGSAVTYVSGTILVLLFTFAPFKEFSLPKIPTAKLFSIVLIAELFLTMLQGNSYSPLFAVYRLGLDARDYQRQLAEIAKQPNVTAEFYKPQIASATERPRNLQERSNVVLIFIEGLSQSIIDDERNLMPYVRQLQAESLSFSGYYNHTFATYRGLIGQLYSGYQLDNYDDNSLISMQDIFRKQGYLTSFVNTEPRNVQFTKYLDAMNFDQLVMDPETTYSGPGGTLSDKEAFETLYETMVAQSDQPYFTAMYTFGTHISMDSPDEKYGDGRNHLLNRFHNLDIQFQAFMEKVKASGMANNTLFVFTTDHATYQDADFIEIFPNYPRVNTDVDEVPLFFYYNGITPQVIEVKGRNSLDMAPTVFDYIGINEENYFLGVSLFFPKENNNSYDTVFYDNSFLLSTDQEVIQPLPEATSPIIEDRLQKYFAAKTQAQQKP
ncbi:TPA: sulfatase-like hydrolase/transferase [Streptococcus suis]